MNEEARTWILTRPDCIKEAMRLFPPGCKVMANGIGLVCPAPDEVARVISYMEDGTLTVHPEDDPEHDIRYQVQPDWIKVVDFYTNDDGEIQDHDWVAAALEGS